MSLGSNSAVVLPDKGDAQQEVSMLLRVTQEPGLTYAWAEMGLAALQFLQCTQTPLRMVNRMMIQTLEFQIGGLLEEVTALIGKSTMILKVGSGFEESMHTCASCKHTGFCFMFRLSEYADKQCRLCFRKACKMAYSMTSMFDWNIIIKQGQ
jgi:hypothetical protein